MNERLASYVVQQKLLKVSDETIKKSLIARGWNEAEIDSALNAPSKKKRLSTFQIMLIIGNVLVLLGLFFNLLFVHPYNSFVVDPTIKLNNDVLLAKIEYQEEVLHSILHSDLASQGNIPVTKELNILFRLSDLLHLQNELIKISNTITTLNNVSIIEYNPVKVANIIEEIKNTQRVVASEIDEQTHDGSLDASWFATN